ncbi:MAG TPA: metalloregulator ArsR/SmtB family transcription factor [Microbacteriaceae bacterium]|nr:metalloregulator ArsR/SmtB family transcription factor [Microbacteriaceae bacterium]
MSELALSPSSQACCAPTALTEPISRRDAEDLSLMLKAVADPTRLQIISFITTSKSSEACVCDITEAFDVSQPTISHHLKVLADAGLIAKDKRGTWAWYAVNTDRWKELAAVFQQTACC